jgi:hypothetical protein
MSDLNLMHCDQLDSYFDAVSETPDLEENPYAKALVRSLMPFPLPRTPRSLTKKTHLLSDCRREATPHDEQPCIQQRTTHTSDASPAPNVGKTDRNGSDVSWEMRSPSVSDDEALASSDASSAPNVRKTDRNGSDLSWEMLSPSVSDDEALASKSKLHETPIDDRERPQGNWNDDYSLSDDDDDSLCGEQLSYFDCDEGNFYFTPTPADAPRSFVPPPTWTLTIYNRPCDDEGDSLHCEEICYSVTDDDDEGHFYFTPTPADSSKSFVPGILTIWDEPKPETTHDEPKPAEPQQKEEVEFMEMIRQSLEKIFSLGQNPDNHSETEERQRKYAERQDSATMLSWSLPEEAKIMPLSRNDSSKTSSTSCSSSSSTSSKTRSIQV